MRLMQISLALLALLVPPDAPAQTHEASPVANGEWQTTDIREIEVDGEPIALSPDGQWLAGTADDGNAVCAWDVETLSPTCAEVAVAVRPALGGMALRWAPDSSAFAFASGDFARLIRGNVMVFDVETGELVNLTNADESLDGPMYVGADWTSDSSQVVFAAFNGLDDESEPDALFRVDRDGGEPVQIPLPAWSEPYDIFYPPLVAGDAVLVSIQAKGEIGGIWRVGLDGSEAASVVPASGPNEVPDPLVASVSPDGRHANVVSIRGMQMLELEGTFFTLDLASGELVPLVSERDLGLVTFAPGGDTGLTVRNDRLATIDPASGATHPVANSPEVGQWLMTVPVWAENDTVFLPGDGGGTLVILTLAD